MTAEFILFFLIGAVSIATAGMMLLSKNAIHSALFLIVNFIGVAVLYLMLEAPFLAMVQIAVYAGAIMVLFLFVIMLLGAERVTRGTEVRRFPWLPAVGMALAVFFVIAVGWALGRGSIDAQRVPDAPANIRFTHAAPVVAAAAVDQAPPVASRPQLPEDTGVGGEVTPADEAAAEAGLDVEPTGEAPAEEVITDVEPPVAPIEPVLDVPQYPASRVFLLLVDGEIVHDAFGYGESTEFVEIAPGEHSIALMAPGGDTILVDQPLEIAAGQTLDLVLAGEDRLTFIPVAHADGSELTIVNAYSPLESISVGDLQNELFNDSRVIFPLVEDLPYGAYASTVQLAAPGEAVVEPDTEAVEGDAAAEVAAETGEAEPVEMTPLRYPAGFPNWVVYRGGLTRADLASRIDVGSVNLTTSPNQSLFSQITVLRLSESLDLEADERGVIIVAPEHRPDGSVRAVARRLDALSLTAFGSPQSLGERLFTEYLLPFQLVALLLLAAMVGVIVITYRGEHVPKPSRTTRRKVSRPLTSVIASQTGTDLTSGAPQLPERTETPAGD